MSAYRGRLAPTPSGLLHVGHAQTFAIAHQRCREASGQLLLRQDDLDVSRCRPEFVQAAETDLRFLGLHWDEGPYSQLARMDRYQQAFDRLVASGAAYPCVCSRKEIQSAQRAPHAEDEEPLYPGTCCQGIPQGREIRCWRLRVAGGEVIEFVDGGQGAQRFVAGSDFGDFVIWRPQGGPSYQLACVVDDAEMQITEVVRGADLLLSTARQLELYRALGWTPPAFYHCPLRVDEHGKRLAKRHDALSIQQLREQGWTADQILQSVAIR